MTQTPLQEAIQIIKARIPKRTTCDFDDGLERAYEEAVEELQSLLPKEKEFVIEVFKSGWRTRNEGKNYTLASDLAEYLSKYNQQ